MQRSMLETSNNQDVQFNVAVNYGSRKEIINACRRLAELVQKGEVKPEDIDENLISNNLYTANIPAPDLLIRTSGEKRLSNFLLWQMAYTEMHFTDVLWPDFDREAFKEALLSYQNRERRFGKVKPVLSA